MTSSRVNSHPAAKLRAAVDTWIQVFKTIVNHMEMSEADITESVNPRKLLVRGSSFLT